MGKNKEKLHTIISNALEINISEVSKDMTIENTSSWDSLNMVKIVLELEKEFGIRLDLNEIIEIQGLDDIEKLLKINDLDI
jgi:acyl carrier protein